MPDETWLVVIIGMLDWAEVYQLIIPPGTLVMGRSSNVLFWQMIIELETGAGVGAKTLICIGYLRDSQMLLVNVLT